MINEVVEHVERTFDHVLHGNSTTLEKVEFGAEVLGVVGIAAVAKTAVGRTLLAKAETNPLLPALEVNIGQSAESALGKSNSIITSSRVDADMMGSPYYKLAPEFANSLRPVLSGKHEDFESFLGSSHEAIASLNRAHLPELPELIIGGTAPKILSKANYAFGVARITAPRQPSWNEFSVQDLFEPAERKEAEGLMGDYLSHETAHHEQLVSAVWRIADKLGVGKVATEEQLGAIMVQRRGSGIVGAVPRSEKAFIEKVVTTRDGRVLEPEQASRADRLIKSFQNNGPIVRRWTQIKTDLEDSRRGLPDGTDVGTAGPDSAAYFEKLSRLRGYELRSGSSELPKFLQGAVDRSIAMKTSHPEISVEQLGAMLGRQQTSRINMLERHDQLLGKKRYVNLLHEKEAYAVGDAVRAAYENR